MSDFSLTLVLQIKTSKIINDIAKVQQKSEKISAFGGICFVLDKFDRVSHGDRHGVTMIRVEPPRDPLFKNAFQIVCKRTVVWV